jgi:hypothetical protein
MVLSILCVVFVKNESNLKLLQLVIIVFVVIPPLYSQMSDQIHRMSTSYPNNLSSMSQIDLCVIHQICALGLIVTKGKTKNRQI